MDIINSLKLNALLLVLLLSILLIHLFHPVLIAIIIIDAAATFIVIVVAVTNLSHRKITVDQLAAIALIISFLHREWLSVGFINLMIVSARLFGMYTESKAKETIKSLLKLRPETVKIEKNGHIITMPIQNIRLGDLIIVESGDRLPVDGIVVSGHAAIDQSSLTGESLPISVEEGDHVLSSTLALSGTLVVRAHKVGADTTFQKIIDLVESAQNSKIKYQTIAEKFAAWYIVISLIISIGIYFFSGNSNLVLSFLLVTCADDIAVGVPLAYWAAIAVAAKNGIIIKGGNYLEALSKVDTLVTDKTGTITKAHLQVIEIHPLIPRLSPEKLLYFAAIPESISEHPLARAIVKDAKRHLGLIPAPTRFREYPGGGVSATYRNADILVGSHQFFLRRRLHLDATAKQLIKKWEQQGSTVVIVSLNHKLVGLIALQDEIKPEVIPTIAKLHQNGIKRIVILTGDNEITAAAIAAKVGITEVYANCRPEDKLHFLQKNINKFSRVAYVGDGVNDSATLAQADVSFAMGVIGADSAIQAADIAIMDDKFSRINAAIALAKATKKVVIQDFVIWGVVNLFGIILVFRGVINPPQAALYNFITDFLPLLNSFRLFGYKIRQ